MDPSRLTSDEVPALMRLIANLRLEELALQMRGRQAAEQQGGCIR
jgi:hypothetical protein